MVKLSALEPAAAGVQETVPFAVNVPFGSGCPTARLDPLTGVKLSVRLFNSVPVLAPAFTNWVVMSFASVALLAVAVI